MSDFVHLHLHSEYSLLDGACRIKDIPAAVKAAGMNAVALTDHGVMYGAVGFYKACAAEGIKPIIGCEVYVSRRTGSRNPADGGSDHLVLLAENEAGYRNLIKLVSLGFTEGYYIDPVIDIRELSERHEGIIALSAGLSGGPARRIEAGDIAGARKFALEMDSIFGRGNFFLEICDHGSRGEYGTMRRIIDIADDTGIPLVLGNDVHYLKKADAEAHHALKCIQRGARISDARDDGFDTDEYYLKSPDEMGLLFPDRPDAYQNTVRIADRCSFDFDFTKRYLPAYKPEDGSRPDDYIRRLAKEGLDRRIADGDIVYDSELGEAEYRQRIEYELLTIASLKFSEYFLIVQDFVNFAKNNKIPTGPGRGSGAGSLVAYLLRITDIDPLRYGLLFETFLNAERITMPDFDIDFCSVRRGEVIRYVSDRYGHDHVCQIIAFNTLAARAAVRDVGRVLGMPPADVGAVARAIPRVLNITLDDALKQPELRGLYESSADVKRLIDIAKLLEGMPRNATTHPAGVVITDNPVSDYVPLSMNDDVLVTQYDMDTLAELGLLKFDFLALRYLSVIDSAEKAIRETDPGFSIEKIPLDDDPAYAAISSGHTDGMFQLESAGMRQLLINMKPASVRDIMVAIALYRPGPMDSIPKFLNNRRDPSKIVWKTPELREILEETCGCIVYQEQVMRIFRFVAGYSYGKADVVRRAIAKKKQGVIEKELDTFIRGAAERGMSESDASALFESMIDFSNYGFKKSHAAAYALISYRTAYLKAHYPAVYCAALMNFSSGTDALAPYLAECERLRIKILPPDINESRSGFRAVSENEIRYGLSFIKNVGRSTADALVAQRDENGVYRSLSDYIFRAKPGEVQLKALESMAQAGAFDVFGMSRKRILAGLLGLLAKAAEKARSDIHGQMDLFGGSSGIATADELSEYPFPEITEEMPSPILLAFEKELTGMYFSGSPFDAYSEMIGRLKPDSSAVIAASFSASGDADPSYSAPSDYRDGVRVRLCGFVTRQTSKATKNEEIMLFVTLEDKDGRIECIVFPKSVPNISPYVTEGAAVVIEGRLSSRDGEEEVKLIAENAYPLLKDQDFRDALNDGMIITDMPKKQPVRYQAPPAAQAVSVQKVQSVQSAPPAQTPSADARPAASGERPKPKQPRLFLRVPSADRAEPSVKRALAVAEIFSGQTPLVLYDAGRKKYIDTGLGINPTEFVIRELTSIVGEGSAVLK